MSEEKGDINIDENDIEQDDLPEDVQFEEVDEDAHTLENVKAVRDKLKVCQNEKAEYLDGWQRAKADAINMRKRLEDDKLASLRIAKEDALSSVIPALDSFDMAFSDEGALKDIDPNWVSGMKGIQSQLLGTLLEYGVKQTNPIGDVFDPNIHDSVKTEETDSPEQDNLIVSVIQKGYEIDGRVLRAAKVVVATHIT